MPFPLLRSLWHPQMLPRLFPLAPCNFFSSPLLSSVYIEVIFIFHLHQKTRNVFKWLDASSTLGFIAPVYAQHIECQEKRTRSQVKCIHRHHRSTAMSRCVCFPIHVELDNEVECNYVFIVKTGKTELISIDRSILITNCLAHVWPIDEHYPFLSISDMPLSFLHLLQSFIFFIGSVCKFSHIIDSVLWTSFALLLVPFRSFPRPRTILSD